MRIAAVQTRPHRGNIQANIDRHLEIAAMCAQQGAEAVFFPELSLTGYEPTLAAELAINALDSRLKVFQELAAEEQLVIGVGAPTIDGNSFNISMIIFHAEEEPTVYPKHYLHHEEEAYFSCGQKIELLLGGKARIAPAICYELSIADHAKAASERGAEIYLASVAKTEEGVTRSVERLSEVARDYGMVTIMANCVGMNDNVLCTGSSAIWSDEGTMMGQLGTDTEGVLLYDTESRQVITQNID